MREEEREREWEVKTGRREETRILTIPPQFIRDPTSVVTSV